MKDIGKDYYDARNFAKEHEWDVFNEWRINKGSDKYPIYEYLSEYRESKRNGITHKTYDFHFVDPRLTDSGITDCAFYVLKYMLKGSGWEQKIKSALFQSYEITEANAYWNTIKSKQKHSLGFGLNATVIGKGQKRDLIYDEDIIEYLKDCIKRSKSTSLYANYYCPEQILSFPLAPYYKEIGDKKPGHIEHKPIYTESDAEWFYLKADKPGIDLDNPIYHQREYTQSIKKFNDYERKLKIAENDCFSEFLQELYKD